MAANIRQIEAATPVDLQALSGYVRAVLDTPKVDTATGESMSSVWKAHPKSYLNIEAIDPAARSVAGMFLDSGEIPDALPPQHPDAIRRAVLQVASLGIDAPLGQQETVVNLIGRTRIPALKPTRREIRIKQRAEIVFDPNR